MGKSIADTIASADDEEEEEEEKVDTAAVPVEQDDAVLMETENADPPAAAASKVSAPTNNGAQQQQQQRRRRQRRQQQQSKAQSEDKDASNDDRTSDDAYDPDRLVPQLADHNITESDLRTAVRVLEAVASLNPRRKKKRRGGDTTTCGNGGSRDGGSASASSGNVAGAAGGGKESKSASNLPSTNDGIQAYRRPNLRPLRKSLAQAYEVHSQTLYSGKSEDEHFADRAAERTLKRRKMSERDQQRKYVANTQLRRGRVERLERLRADAMEEERGKLEAMRRKEMEMMVPDGHVDTQQAAASTLMLEDGRERPAAAVTATATAEENGSEKKPPAASAASSSSDAEPIQLPKLRSCYVCKVRFRELHHFYDQLCPPCAALNFGKRHQTAGLSGRVAVVTGSRVKIGYQTCLKLLRAGCTVIATTRFPNSAARTYRDEKDFDAWGERLHVYGLDLRDVTGLEAFTRFLKIRYGGGGEEDEGDGGGGGIDILINNACQTVRRPRGYYVPMVEREQELWNEGDGVHRGLLGGCVEFERVRRKLVLDHSSKGGGGGASADRGQLENGAGSGADVPLLQMGMDVGSSDAKPAAATAADSGTIATSSASTAVVAPASEVDGSKAPFESTGVSHSAAMSQMVILPEDVGVNPSILPPGVTDVNGQQLDLRHTNSWLLKMDEVSTPEVMECMFVNAIAPFVLNSRLKPLMTTPAGTDRPDRYIINVSAMEGKFYRYKMPNHPHTNMAKAALNMLTRTSSEDLAKRHRIYMNSVDTGWINDENPLEKASTIAKTNLFQTPIDEIDAAARILDPIFTGVAGGGGGGEGKGKGGGGKGKGKEYGKFFKDYRETEW